MTVSEHVDSLHFACFYLRPVQHETTKIAVEDKMLIRSFGQLPCASAGLKKGYKMQALCVCFHRALLWVYVWCTLGVRWVYVGIKFVYRVCATASR